MKDKNSQLLLLAIVILALALILIAASAAVLLSVKKELPSSTENLGAEFLDLKLKFGYALEDELSSKRNSLNMSVNDSNNITVRRMINETLRNVSSQVEFLEALRGRIFNASYNLSNTFWAKASINANYTEISFDVAIKLQAQDLDIKETNKYLFSYSTTISRYEVEIL